MNNKRQDDAELEATFIERLIALLALGLSGYVSWLFLCWVWEQLIILVGGN